MRQIVRTLDEMQEGQPTSDPYSTTFDVIVRGSSLEGLHRTAKAACSILSTEEQKVPKISQFDAAIRVVIEFFSYVDAGPDGQPNPDGTLNRVLGDIQRRMREDVHLTEPDDGRDLIDRQLSVDVEETGNQGFIDGYADQTISGAVFYRVKYKHAPNDPREVAGNR